MPLVAARLVVPPLVAAVRNTPERPDTARLAPETTGPEADTDPPVLVRSTAPAAPAAASERLPAVCTDKSPAVASRSAKERAPVDPIAIERPLALIGPAELRFATVTAPFALVSAFDALYVGVVIAVTTESARDLSRVPEVVRGAWKRLKGFTAPCALLLAVAAPVFLIPNGRDYMENAAWPLRFLALASIPHAVVMLYSSILRVQTRGGRLMSLQIVNVALSFFVQSNAWGPLRSGPWGAVVGLVAVGLAAASLIVDFDSIKRGVVAGVPRRYAWTAAFGLVVTLVWLYLEFLRLFAIISRN